MRDKRVSSPPCRSDLPNLSWDATFHAVTVRLTLRIYRLFSNQTQCPLRSVSPQNNATETRPEPRGPYTCSTRPSKGQLRTGPSHQVTESTKSSTCCGPGGSPTTTTTSPLFGGGRPGHGRRRVTGSTFHLRSGPGPALHWGRGGVLERDPPRTNETSRVPSLL